MLAQAELEPFGISCEQICDARSAGSCRYLHTYAGVLGSCKDPSRILRDLGDTCIRMQACLLRPSLSQSSFDWLAKGFLSTLKFTFTSRCPVHAACGAPKMSELPDLQKGPEDPDEGGG